MAVDPRKPRKILVVHGVQTGTDADINAHERIKRLIDKRLNGVPVKFETAMYRYENINDEAQAKLRRVLEFFVAQLTGQTPFGSLLGTLVDAGVDLVGDVLVNLADGCVAAQIRNGLMNEIKSIYEDGNPLYLVAHSLGTIYSFDVVNELMRDDAYFDRNSRRTWPVQALMTLGSPIGLSMFNRNAVVEMGDGRKFFRWINIWSRTDPVVSGNFYGRPQEGYEIAEKFTTNTERSGWFIHDRAIATGSAWLKAHVGYWRHAGIGDELVSLITS